ncbi:hypothetical protein A2U01_0107329 [Trifolium medium]|uniref:Uncharacterized protein n=1 Tax=Trifolium medium TaxID=97028 RepID=A0A392VI41_9FABA|nr:hypothetical protein [Trifolium medium]
MASSSSRCGGSGPLLLLNPHMGAILLIKHHLIAVHDGLVLNLIRLAMSSTLREMGT